MAQKESAANLIAYHLGELAKAARFKLDARMIEMHTDKINEVFADMGTRLTKYEKAEARQELMEEIADTEGIKFPTPPAARIRGTLQKIVDGLRENAATANRHGKILGVFGLAEVGQMQDEFAQMQLDHADRLEKYIAGMTDETPAP